MQFIKEEIRIGNGCAPCAATFTMPLPEVIFKQTMEHGTAMECEPWVGEAVKLLLKH